MFRNLPGNTPIDNQFPFCRDSSDCIIILAAYIPREAAGLTAPPSLSTPKKTKQKSNPIVSFELAVIPHDKLRSHIYIPQYLTRANPKRIDDETYPHPYYHYPVLFESRYPSRDGGGFLFFASGEVIWNLVLSFHVLISFLLFWALGVSRFCRYLLIQM